MTTSKSNAATLLAEMDARLCDPDDIPEVLRSARSGFRFFRRESREYLRGSLQLAAKATMTLIATPRAIRKFLRTIEIKPDDRSYSFDDVLRLVLGQIFVVGKKEDKDKVNRYARALLELRHLETPVECIAEAIKSSRGGIDALAEARAARLRGETPKVRSPVGVNISIGAKRFRVSAADLVAAADAANRKGRLLIRYKIDETGSPIAIGNPKIVRLKTTKRGDRK